MRFFSSISLEVFLCHMVFYRLVEKTGLLRIFGNEVLSYIVVVIIVLTASTIFAVAVQKLIRYISALGLGHIRQKSFEHERMLEN